jgi:hypothetical protein
MLTGVLICSLTGLHTRVNIADLGDVVKLSNNFPISKKLIASYQSQAADGTAYKVEYLDLSVFLLVSFTLRVPRV